MATRYWWVRSDKGNFVFGDPTEYVRFKLRPEPFSPTIYSSGTYWAEDSSEVYAAIQAETSGTIKGIGGSKEMLARTPAYYKALNRQRFGRWVDTEPEKVYRLTPSQIKYSKEHPKVPWSIIAASVIVNGELVPKKEIRVIPIKGVVKPKTITVSTALTPSSKTTVIKTSPVIVKTPTKPAIKKSEMVDLTGLSPLEKRKVLNKKENLAPPRETPLLPAGFQWSRETGELRVLGMSYFCEADIQEAVSKLYPLDKEKILSCRPKM